MLLSQLLSHFELQTAAPLSEDFEIKGVRPLTVAGKGELSFLSNPKYRNQVATSRASAILVREVIADTSAIQILCKDPYVSLARVLTLLYPEVKPKRGVHPSSVVDPSALIHASAFVGPQCVVGSGSVIGEGAELVARVTLSAGCKVGSNCKLFPGVVLYPGVSLGEKVRIHANTVVGSDGFGYAQDQGQHIKVPQIGSVVIGDGVEIGACTTIDRGCLDDTEIGAGTIIDNQVQIAHGVKLGKASVIVSQCGISGSARIGNHSMLAGKVGVVGHVTIADKVVVMGDSVVTKNLKQAGRYAGNPAIPHIQYQRQLAHVRTLPDLKKRIKQLETRLGEKND